ncbi:MAG TPA: hypothetical protein VG889_21295 [Rhizomicrobium sp.]|nr:hypothetical protein [Rhizomicrobium sp.]
MIKLSIATGLVLAGICSTAIAADAKQTVGATMFTSAVGQCSGGTGSCIAAAACPLGVIKSGGWWYIVPDGTNPAYGICNNAAGLCKSGVTSCAIQTSPGTACGSPGWSRQMAQVTISCVQP